MGLSGGSGKISSGVQGWKWGDKVGATVVSWVRGDDGVHLGGYGQKWWDSGYGLKVFSVLLDI